ncbi:Putative two-component membrane permease complex subunit SMU_747c [Fundidesulfovibrio magnetotacticus]|uniref:Two-component membrane permease complex subunit SMU_747c n=1 Tax=Fundidesulfovibrio magnetotacticus TaxID=2730080 RepID=A0A6V8LUK1_9BACT|nr:permease [Fundidesulfovibrio magnetotacticus]GFK94630.1 Putative two-component membrane permease complex subunit SMU_747c [Fundidesulfovibrio magnetotacticus]
MEFVSLFAQVLVAILLEAAPFLLLGALASGLFEVFVPAGTLERLMPRGTATGILAGLVLGMVMPCCECGIVPLIRRLLGKGVPPATAMTFMLAGPVINPVVLASTLVAFQGDLGVVVVRCVLVAGVACAVGVAVRGRTAQELLLPGARPVAAACGCGGEPGLFGSLADMVTPADVRRPSLLSRLDHALRHAQADFLDMFRVLVFGAAVAAAFKTLAPAGVVNLVEKDLLLSVSGMMGLAVVLSLCSQADAFVAASFSGFPLAAKAAFLALGPVLDIKLVLMWRGVFRPEIVRLLIVIPAASIFAACMLMGVLEKWPR